ncbi:MAG TPA: hypothetical protein VIA18_20560 [Polyangia bacterium]|nr:hypothetical protein [Polyangia bacterium]
MKCWCRVLFVAALAGGGCAKPFAPESGEDLGHGVVGTGGNGDADLAPAPTVYDLAEPPRDLSPVCGDNVCTAAIGENCSTCPEDCGSCPGCAPNTADCDGDPTNGCETPIDTPTNCGACGRVCQQVGGTNACISNGTNWVCKPTCDTTHGDCNGMPNDGCETDTTTTTNCSGCGISCVNPNGTTACADSGTIRVCDPSCSAGFADCDGLPGQGCTTNIESSPTSCGSCTRACSSVGAASLACTSGLCTPTCSYPFADCSRPASPAADDGCETNGTVDPGENDNTCSGQYTSTDEGTVTTVTTNRILPATDVDTFQVHLSEGSHICFPGTGQPYDARIEVIPPPGVDLRIQINTSGTCNNTWTAPGGTYTCYPWNGTCGGNDDRDLYVQVFGFNGANSCTAYQLVITYASEGNNAPGC